MISENKIAREKVKTVALCKECLGSGCSACALKCARFEKYAESGIPVSFWTMSFKNFAGDKNFKNSIKKVVSNIDEFYDKGESLMFVGSLGTGKSYMASVILKIALSKNYICTANIIFRHEI